MSLAPASESRHSHVFAGANNDRRRGYVVPDPDTESGLSDLPEAMLSRPQRSHVERVCNVTHSTEMSCGGHFAAMERPNLLFEDSRAFACTLR